MSDESKGTDKAAIHGVDGERVPKPEELQPILEKQEKPEMLGIKGVHGERVPKPE